MNPLPILGSVLGGLFNRNAANDAADAQARAAQDQLDFNKKVYRDQRSQLAPWVGYGRSGMDAYMNLLGLNGAPDMSRFTESPGYQFRLNEGMDAVQSSAAARGMLGSGSAMRGLMETGQGLASDEWNTYLNRLAGLGAGGQAAAAGGALAAGQYGANGMNILGNLGDIRAGGIIGGANALTSGINDAIGTWSYLRGTQQPGQTGGGMFNFLGG